MPKRKKVIPLDHNLYAHPVDRRDPEFADLREQVFAQMQDITASDELIARTLRRVDQTHRRRLRTRIISAAAACVMLIGLSMAVIYRTGWFNVGMSEQDAAEMRTMIGELEGTGMADDINRQNKQAPDEGIPAPMLLDGMQSFAMLTPTWYAMQAHIIQVIPSTNADAVPIAAVSGQEFTILTVELTDACQDACGRPIIAEIYVLGAEAQSIFEMGQDVIACLEPDAEGHYVIADYARQIIPLQDGLTSPLVEDAYIPSGLTVEDAINNY